MDKNLEYYHAGIGASGAIFGQAIVSIAMGSEITFANGIILGTLYFLTALYFLHKSRHTGESHTSTRK